MNVPLELTFRNVEKSSGLEDYIHRELRGLEEVNERIVSCRVAVERPQEHQTRGSGYRVRIVARVPPRREVVIRREPGEGELHDDLRTVLKAAFDAARRHLRELDRELRGEVKEHWASDETGLVTRLFREEGYGFLRSLTGREVYFHRNSVLRSDFDRLEIGAQVRFTPEMGEKGLQASSLERVGEPALRSSGEATEPAAEPTPGWKS